MSIKRFLFPALLVCAILALLHRLFARLSERGSQSFNPDPDDPMAVISSGSEGSLPEPSHHYQPKEMLRSAGPPFSMTNRSSPKARFQNSSLSQGVRPDHDDPMAVISSGSEGSLPEPSHHYQPTEMLRSAGPPLSMTNRSSQNFGDPASKKPVSKNTPNDAVASYEAIDAYVEKQMHRLNIPGASLAIVEGDQIVHLRGFGRARPDGGRLPFRRGRNGNFAPTPQTPFFIGSLTKSITALAVMQLVEAGKVELDAPVQRYLPWFRVADPQASVQMTVRHLLNQTSSLPFLLSEIAHADFDDRPDATERQVRALSTLKISRPVGSQCEYSNFNYNILGLIVESASGESYADYIQNHIFDPLDMRHSYTSKAEAKPNGLAVGHRHWFSLPFPVPDMPVPVGMLPSGQLISCAEDMAHYLIAHLNGGCYAGVQVLSEAGIDEMHRGVLELKMGDIAGEFYGMGWFDIDLGQTKTYSHAGNVPDFSAFMAIVPEQKKGVVLLFNADPYGLPIITGEVGMGVTALLASQPPAPIRLDFIQWIMRSLPLIPLLQIVGVLATLRLLRRWREDPKSRPSLRRTWGQHILLPLIPNLALAGILVYLQSSRIIRFLRLFMPDLAWITQISGTFAGIWALVRTGLILGALRKP